MSSRDYQPKNVKRHKGITAEVPVIYGNLSWMLGKKDPFHTHKWTAFLRGTRNEDLTFFIKKVVFNLHDTFDKPKRVLTTPPFEVTATGWGEFELSIKIYFIDPNERPVELFHQLRLYPVDGSQPQISKKPLVFEQYDEIVFNDPTEIMYKKLKHYHFVRSESLFHPLATYSPINFNEEEELAKIVSAREKVQEEIAHLRDRFEITEREIEQLRDELQIFE